MQIIPLAATPSQTFNITLNNQACTINVYEKDISYTSYNPVNFQGQPVGVITPNNTLPAAVYVDLYINNVLVIGGVVALNGKLIVRNAYLGFIGDLVFFDTQGTKDPLSAGFGARPRYLFFYLLPSDVAAL
jgi:hypothetical protein